MTWLYLPGSTSAPVTEAWNSLDAMPVWNAEPWLTLSGKPTQRPSLWRGWQRRGWIRHLSGLTLKRSTVARLLAEWMESLPDSHVNRSALPDPGLDLPIPDICGPTQSGSSAKWDRVTCSWRTLPTLFEPDGSEVSWATLPTSGSMRNGVYCPQPPLAPLTDGNGSGSWPTPEARPQGASDVNRVARGYGLSLMDRGLMWGTPVARDDQKSPEAHLAMKQRMGGNRTAVTSLTVQAKMWPTPRASDGTRGSDPPHGDGGPSLKQAAGHGLLAPTTTRDGSTTSPRADLNPSFVAALMGLPPDWLTPSTSAETDSSHKPQPKRSDNSQPVEVG